MRMNSSLELPLKRVDALIFALLGFIELGVSAIYLALTADRYPDVFSFGLLKQPVLELVLLSLLVFFFLLILVRSIKDWPGLQTGFGKTHQKHKAILLMVFLLGLVIGWAVATIPPTFFGRFADYYQWLRPAGIVLGLIALQGWILYLFRSGRYTELDQPARVVGSKVFMVVFFLLVTIFTFTYRTKFGLVADTPLWNVPGVPISGMQMLLLVVAFAILLIADTVLPRFHALLSRSGVQVVIILLIFISTVLIWGFTPLQGDSLAIEPTLANPQPYPLRDARVHDMGALSILFGQGINFGEYTDKPLYMVILALFHLITGYDYRLLQWVQIAFLALIPVLAYLLGKRLHSKLFGVLLAVLITLQQRNAVLLSRMISSVNVKILVTETFVLMGVLFLTLLISRWQDHNDKRIMLLAGGTIGALSLIRLNPLLFLPFIGLVIIIRYWKRKKLLASRLLLFVLGFGIVFTPWVFSGRNAQGQPYFFVKIRDIFENRIVPQVNVENPASLALSIERNLISFRVPVENVATGDKDAGPSFIQVELSGVNTPSAILEGMASVKGAESIPQYLRLLSNHFLHNLTTSVIPLPDVLSTEGVRVLAQRDYWDDMKIWDGSLSGGLIRFIIINLILVSLGVARSWKSHGWLGLLPLGIFLVYNLAISISLTSGGRYIVPIIWVVFLYYALGIVFLIEAFLRLSGRRPIVIQQVDQQKPVLSSKPILPVLVGLIIVALLVPVANQLLPLLISRSPVERVNTWFAALGPERQHDRKYYSGIVLYPVYEAGRGRVSFDLYRGHKTSPVVFDLLPEQGADVSLDTRLECGDPVLLEFGMDDRLSAVYVFREDQLFRYWHLAATDPREP